MHQNHLGKNFVSYLLFPLINIFLSYESKFQSNVRDSFKEGKHEHRTMGYADEPVPDPQQFLKKKQNASKATGSSSRMSLCF